MDAILLVVNCGSSSVKFAVYAVESAAAAEIEMQAHGQLEGIPTRPKFVAFDHLNRRLAEETILPGNPVEFGHDEAIEHLLGWVARHFQRGQLLAVGHRVVHGADRYVAPVLVTADVIQQLEALVPLAPLHQPHSLAGIRAVAKARPDVRQVACFDTAFHRTQPAVAQAFALPREITEAGVKRYGFHGLSYEYIASVLPEHLGRGADGRVVVAHLGNGASMCAMLNRKSVASTMGFTALDGLMMGTRCGSLDPGVLLYLLQERGMNGAQVADLLYHQSGLLGVSGIASDMRTLLASNEPAAQQAIDLFVYRIGRELGSLAAALGGLDAFVFTGGIGEHAASIREQVCRQAEWLGIRLDGEANAARRARISSANSAVSVWVIETDEERVIACATLELLAQRG